MNTSLRQNLGVLFGTVVFCFVVSEAVCRAARFITAARDASIPLLEPSRDPELVFELRRSARGEINSLPVVVNEDGFRDPPWSDGALDSSDTDRIMVIGDSVAFGWGVAQDDAFPRVLELERNAAGRKTRVYNVSVPGYGLEQELRLIRIYSPRLKPSRIIIAYCLNDPDPVGASTEAFHILHPPAVETWYLVSRVWDYLRYRRSGLDYHEYIHRRGGTALASYFHTLAQIHQSGIPTTLLILPVFAWNGSDYPYRNIDGELTTAATQAGLQVIDAADALMNEPVDRVGLDSWHPTPRGHRIIADAIAASLKDER